ncbi:MAG: UDP-N-acetylmuramoyl-L-alanine--D-glutamate ligase [Candidatus Omnitrophica bacterium]|nr:UDP-N-acetylmuramoyl-L-alanine--D-glutamate ligase [Candidatus Omnitrophota bacterium]
MRIQGKKIVVVGLSRSGEAAARLARRQGAQVYVTDCADTAAVREKAGALARRGIAVEYGAHTEAFLSGAAAVVASPGVKPSAPPLAWARVHRIPIYSEIEFAGWFCRAPVIAITGSNGKTTTTTLLGAIFRRAGWKAVVCGNIGIPWSAVIARAQTADVVVLEVSSFQLEHIERFRPRVAVVLNLSQNHFDHHADMREYARAKANITRNQTKKDYLVLNADDARVRAFGAKSSARICLFSRRIRRAGRFPGRVHAAVGVDDGRIVEWRAARSRRWGDTADIRIPGAHNLENVLAAALAARCLGVSPEIISRAVRAFRGVEHRCEPVARVRGVHFINDAKSTTVDATVKALEMCAPQSVLLICGGRDKGSDFKPIVPLLAEKARGIILIGEAAEKIAAACNGAVSLVRAASLREAVRRAYVQARPGDSVLLSPMCASFDMFENYEDRGRQFKALVRELAAAARRRRGSRGRR